MSIKSDCDMIMRIAGDDEAVSNAVNDIRADLKIRYVKRSVHEKAVKVMGHKISRMVEYSKSLERKLAETKGVRDFVRLSGGVDTMRASFNSSRDKMNKLQSAANKCKTYARILDDILRCVSADGKPKSNFRDDEGCVTALKTIREALDNRLMPLGYVWPRFEDEQIVHTGSFVDSGNGGVEVESIEFGNGKVVISGKSLDEDRKLKTLVYDSGEKVKRYGDSWASIEKDSMLDPMLYCEKFGRHFVTYKFAAEFKTKDLVSRAKKMSGVE